MPDPLNVEAAALDAANARAERWKQRHAAQTRRLKSIADLARTWANQPTDYDEDTEQQIEDGHKLLDLLAATEDHT